MKKIFLILVALTLLPMFILGGCAILFGALGSTNTALACGQAGQNTDGKLTIKGRPATQAQLKIASTIVSIGRNKKWASDRDIKIALMVGMQESSLTNISYGTYNAEAGNMSIGVFQQTPPWWGTAEQILNVTYATNSFYRGLESVENRDRMSLMAVALAVQNPDPAAYNSSGNDFDDQNPNREEEAERLLSSQGQAVKNCSAAGNSAPGKVVVEPGANFPGQPISDDTMEFLKLAASYAGRELVVSTGTAHSYMTSSGNVSDHVYRSGQGGFAADFGNYANGSTNGGVVGDKIMFGCLRAAGLSFASALDLANRGGAYTYYNVTIPSLRGVAFRVQCLWKTYVGGDHYTHVHMAANPNG